MKPKTKYFALLSAALIVCVVLSTAPTTTLAVSTGDTDWRYPEPSAGLADSDGSADDRLLMTPELLAELEAFEQAYNQGPQAVLDIRERLSRAALDKVGDEIVAAEMQLAEPLPLSPARRLVLEDEALQAQVQLAADAGRREQALHNHVDLGEGWQETQLVLPQKVSPARANADLTVGDGCTYASIGQALAAAQPGDRLLLEGGRTFVENVTVPITVTIEGGYSGCASGSSSRTTIDGGHIGRVIDIASGLQVSLIDLVIENGKTSAEGGGVRMAAGTGGGTLTMDNVCLNSNAARWGGGLWVGSDAEVVGTDVSIYGNTATAYGGGVRLFGSTVAFTATNIFTNTAALGGGIHGTRENGFTPELRLASGADVFENEALPTGDGLGGGVYLSEGEVNIASASDVDGNRAVSGGGLYLITSTLTIDGCDSEVSRNIASDSGGGVHALGSVINLDDEAEILGNRAYTGAGVYLDASILWGDKAEIGNNVASQHGGGIYAVNDSTVDMDLGDYVCITQRCSRLYGNGAGTGYGGALYSRDSAVDLRNTSIEGNTSVLGGGIYAQNGSVELYNSLVAENDASNSADGVRLFSGSELLGNGNTFAYNDAGGASTGEAIGLYNAEMTLGCAIIWGHNTSINVGGTNVVTVSYSDIQGAAVYPGTGNLNIDPSFVAPASGDYHLQIGSPVIDKCPSLSGLTNDFDNEDRPIFQSSAATPYDMGADEFSAPRVGVDGAGCAFGTVTQAIAAARDGGTVQVSSGTFYESVTIDGAEVAVTGGYDSDCLTPDVGSTVISGTLHSGSVVFVDGGTVVLRNLELAGGNTSRGGGMELYNAAQVTLDRVVIADNQAIYGGGIYVNAGSALTLTNESVIRGNEADVVGGGIRLYASSPTTLTVQDSSKVLDNKTVSGVGGGLAMLGAGIMEIQDAEIRGNVSAADGGGIFLDAGTLRFSGGATLRSNDAAGDGGAIAAVGTADVDFDVNGYSIAYDNSAKGGDGGFLYVTSDTTVDVHPTGNTMFYIYANQASRHGGAVYADAGASIDLVSKVYVDHNWASDGNGGAFYLAGESELWLTQSGEHAPELWDNRTYTGNGAVVYASDGSGVHCRGAVLGRSGEGNLAAGSGGALYLSGSMLDSENCVFVDNVSDANGGAIAAYTSTVAISADTGVCDPQLGECSSLLGNVADDDGDLAGYGGGIYSNDSILTVEQTKFKSNGAVRGGAIYHEGSQAHALLSNTLIYSNTTTQNFGAGVRTSAGAYITATHVTLANNVGGAAFSPSSSSAWVSNSAAWGNDSGFVRTYVYTDCNIDQSGKVGVVLDPEFFDPGSGEDYHLSENSLAIDACDNGLGVDLDGIARPIGEGYDIGAYEAPLGINYIYLPLVQRGF